MLFSIRALLAAAFLPLGVAAQDGAVDPGFAPVFRQPGLVEFVRAEPEGTILVAGKFEFFNGVPARGVVRLAADGSVLETPNLAVPAGATWTVLDRFPDGGLLVEEIAGFPANGIPLDDRSDLRRVLRNGNADPAFTRITVSGSFRSVLVLPGGGVVVLAAEPIPVLRGGNGVMTTLRRHRADGQVDPGFLGTVSAGGFRSTIVRQTDGRILLGGTFRQGTGAGLITRSGIARFRDDGSLDPTFDCTAPNLVTGPVAVEADGRILYFATESPAGFRRVLRRLSVSGAPDPAAFTPPALVVGRVVALPDGRILAQAEEANGSPGGLLRLAANGAVDPGFSAPLDLAGVGLVRPDLTFNSIALLTFEVVPDGGVLFGGCFFGVGADPATSLALLGPSGRVRTDVAFGTGAEDSGRIAALGGVDAQQRIVVSGAFSSINGTRQTLLARLDRSGAPDPAFQPRLPFFPGYVGLRADGSMLVARYGGEGTPVVRVEANGNLDPSFGSASALLPSVPERGGQLEIFAQAVAADGSALLAGGFRPNRAAGPGLYGIARLNASTGALDEAFHAGGGLPIAGLGQFTPRTLHSLAAGGLLCGGSETIATGLRGRLLRFDGTGAVEAAFAPDLPFDVSSVAVQPDGRILVSGPSRGPQLVRLLADGSGDGSFVAPPAVEDGEGYGTLLRQSDGRLLVVGNFQTLGGRQRGGVARLRADGAFDDSFQSGSGPAFTAGTGLTFEAVPRTAALMADGSVLVAGFFDRFSGFQRSGLVRLLNASVPAAPPVPRGRLINVSTRAAVGAGERVVIGGFVLSGTGTRRIIVRALGPTLTPFGIGGALPNPRLRLVNAAGQTVAVNDNWQDGNPAALAAAGLEPANASESAIVADLGAGAYTAIVDDVGGVEGNALVEVYDLSPDGTARVVNLSTRAVAHPDVVGSGFEFLGGFPPLGSPDYRSPMIGGFVIRGGPCRVLIRSLGPSLAQFGVASPISDVQLVLRAAGAPRLRRPNGDWQTQEAAGDVALIRASGFAPLADAESAVIVELPEGSYTAVVEPAPGGSSPLVNGGIATVEIYEVP